MATTPGPGDPSLRYPFPYINPSVFDRSWGRSNYNGLQFLFEKRFSQGLAYTVSYTWSKAIDIGCWGWYQVEGCAVQDPYHFNLDRSVAGFDLTHILTANWTYELPFGRGKALQSGIRPVDFVIGGWQLNGIAEFTTGQPYTMNITGDIANTKNSGYRAGYMRLHQVGNPYPAASDPAKWFDQNAFATPAVYTFGSLGRNTMRSDWIRHADVSVFRQFDITEKKHLEFRAEAFNLTNTPIFVSPISDKSNVNFGKSLSTRFAPRKLQLGLKLVF